MLSETRTNSRKKWLPFPFSKPLSSLLYYLPLSMAQTPKRSRELTRMCRQAHIHTMKSSSSYQGTAVSVFVDITVSETLRLNGKT